MTRSYKALLAVVSLGFMAAVYQTGCCVQKHADKAKYGVDSCIQDYLKAHPGYNVRDVIVSCKPTLNPVVLKAVQK